MKKLFWIVAVLFLFIAIFFIYSFRTQIDKTKIPLSGEMIYLKHLSRGISYEVDVISINSYTKAKPDTTEDYVSWDGRGFYYKIENDSLYVYGGNWITPSNRDISLKIKFISIEDSFLNYFNNYKKIGLKYFPSSLESSTYTPAN